MNINAIVMCCMQMHVCNFFSSVFNLLKTCNKQLLDADGPVEVTAAGVIIPPTNVHEAAMEEPMAETELELEAAETKESEPEAQISPTPAFASLNADPEPPKKAGAPTEKEWFQFWWKERRNRDPNFACTSIDGKRERVEWEGFP